MQRAPKPLLALYPLLGDTGCRLEAALVWIWQVTGGLLIFCESYKLNVAEMGQ